MKDKIINNSAQKIANRINSFKLNSEFSFLFGAGINFNIANNPTNWENLSKDSIFQHFKDNLKKRTLWEKEVLAKEVVNLINDNKVSASFSDEVKLNINSKDKEKNKWFIDGFRLIENKLIKKPFIMTLNYDKVLSYNLNRQPINFYLNESLNPRSEILHLHGNLENNLIKKNRTLFHLESYIFNNNKVEKKLFNFLLGKINDKQKNEDISYTLLIIGASLREEHILKSFKKFFKVINKNFYDFKIFWIRHLPNQKIILNKMQEIYNKFNIEIININSAKTYEEDFKLFWKCLSNKIKKHNLDFKKNNLNKSSVINENNLYLSIKNKFKKNKNLKLKEIIKELELENIPSKSLIQTLYMLEKKDQIVKEGTLKKYILNNLKEISFENFSFIINESFSEKEILKIFQIIENKINNNNNNFISSNFYEKKIINNYWNQISFSKHKNIINFLIKQILNEKFFNKNLEDKLLKDITLSNIDFENIFLFPKFKYLKEDNFFTKIIFNTIKKEGKILKLDLPQNPKDIYDITVKYQEKYQEKYKVIFLLFFFSIEDYKKIIYENIDECLNILKNNFILEKNFTYVFFILLCFVFLNDNEKGKYFRDELKKIENFWEDFPTNSKYLGLTTDSTPNFSKFDGQSIKKKKIIFKNLEEIENKLKQYNYLSQNEQNAIFFFLNKELKNKKNLEWLKKISLDKKIISNIFHYFMNKNITIEFKNWEDYLEYIEIKNIDKMYLLNLKPPYDLHERLIYLMNELEEKQENFQNINEITNILKIKLKLNYYSQKHILFINEIKTLMNMYFKNNVINKNFKLKKILNDIFKKAFKWEPDYFQKILKKKIQFKNYNEFLFHFLFTKKQKNMNNYNFSLIFNLIKNKKIDENKSYIIFDIIHSIILNEKKEKQINYFIQMINYASNQKEKQENWINYWKKIIIYYNIFFEIKLDFDKIKLDSLNIFDALLINKKNLKKFKSKENRILELLDNSRKTKYFFIFLDCIYKFEELIDFLDSKIIKKIISMIDDYKDDDEYNYYASEEKFKKFYKKLKNWKKER